VNNLIEESKYPGNNRKASAGGSVQAAAETGGSTRCNDQRKIFSNLVNFLEHTLSYLSSTRVLTRFPP
jgi:hypothetical protein